jgi:predicted acetyltransferase
VINPVTMATLDRPLKMVPVAAEHHAVMKELQSAQAQRSSGQLERPEALWRFKLGPHDDVVDGHMLVSSAGPEGYVLASRKQRRRLDLVDWCALTPEAVRQVVRFLADARSIADQVSWIGGPEDPLVHALPEKGVRVEQADHWLSRVVDARRALEIRGYPLGIRRSLVLELDDADLSWNRGAHLLEVTEGRGLVSAARGSAAPRLRLSIGAMAPLYSGHLAPSVLRAIGALQGDDNALEIAAAIFAGPRPWMADDF